MQYISMPFLAFSCHAMPCLALPFLAFPYHGKERDGMAWHGYKALKCHAMHFLAFPCVGAKVFRLGSSYNYKQKALK
jgi:hypothetical protein